MNDQTIATELFTELTPEQTSIIEGGSFLFVQGIEAVKANADTFGKDDTYIKANAGTFWGPVSMGTGDYKTVNRALQFDGSAAIEVKDKDGRLNGDDDSMGGFTVTASPTNGQAIARVSGSGSIYNVYYSVFG